MITRDDPLYPSFLALHTHWCVADAVRFAMYYQGAETQAAQANAELGATLAEMGRLQSTFMRLLVFYALVYVVVEGYQELKLPDPAVEELLAGDLIQKLRRFRNATFHYQSDPINERQFEFLLVSESEIWIRKLHRALERYISSYLPIEQHLTELRDLVKKQNGEGGV